MNQPQWLENLLEVFLHAIEWTSIKTPTHQTFTFRSQHVDETWEITISPFLHEIYGGKHDGALRLPTYELNMLTVANEFDKLTYIGFDTDRTEASIEGEINGESVTLIFRRLAPKSKTRKKINTFTGEVTKIVTNDA
jgi:hypothetical protein